MKGRWYLPAATLLVMLVTAQGLLAQQQRRQGPGPFQGGRALGGSAALALEHKADLDLSDQQVEQLEVIVAETEEATKELRDRMDAARGQMRAGGGDRSQMRSLMQEMRDALAPFEERSEALLSADQLKALEQYRPRGRRGPPGS